MIGAKGDHSMSRIDVDPEKLETCVQKLKTLYSDLATAEALPEGADDSMTYDMIRREYEEMLGVRKSMLLLIQNTLDALEYAQKAMVMTDTAKADAEKSLRLQRMTEDRTVEKWK